MIGNEPKSQRFSPSSAPSVGKRATENLRSTGLEEVHGNLARSEPLLTEPITNKYDPEPNPLNYRKGGSKIGPH